ncbi:MAG: hypothetical protein LBV49_04480 [Azonexus sp.]|jgi:signal transduction histidine kinase|nr:hypothetical protein [Azonexus sp.]
MQRHKPELLALIVALIGTLSVLAAFLVDLAMSRQRDLEAGERQVERFGIMVAEHTARSLEAVDTLLHEMAGELSLNRRDWRSWDATRGTEYLNLHHARAMPQLRYLALFDYAGDQRFVSTYFAPPPVNIRHRPYFIALEKGAKTATYGPFVGPNSGRHTYVIAYRINNADGRFAGVAVAAIEPAYLQDFCWPNRLSDDFESVLVNARGLIVGACRPTDPGHTSALLGRSATEVLFAGKLRDQTPEIGSNRSNGLLVTVSPVPNFADLRILTAIPEATLLAGWQSRFVELSTLGGLVTVALLVGGLMVRRQVRDLAAMTGELAASHEHLEERVHEATEALAEQKEAAERANRAKSRFLAAASHDLRQPLHALSLFAADLQRQVKSGIVESLPRLSEQIANSTSLLGELLDSLLDISRLDVAETRPDICDFALQPVFERLNNAFRRAAIDRNLTLRFRRTGHWLNSDPLMVERMIANLVSNALRYTPGGGRVLVAARRRGEMVRIEVRDNGVGIAAEHQTAIFAEFYQVGNRARETSKGLGLGLSIVDRLARVLGARINLISQPGAGATFALEIPLHHLGHNEVLPRRSPSAGAVYLLGDSPDLRTCGALLEGWHYAVDTMPESGRPVAAGIIIIADADRAGETVASCPEAPLIVIGADGLELPPEAHVLPLPVRPAKLRALVAQLQRTLRKSIP